MNQVPAAILAFFWALFYVPGPAAPVPPVVISLNAARGFVQPPAPAPVARAAAQFGPRGMR